MKEGNQGQGGSVTAARETAASHRAARRSSPTRWRGARITPSARSDYTAVLFREQWTPYPRTQASQQRPRILLSNSSRSRFLHTSRILATEGGTQKDLNHAHKHTQRHKRAMVPLQRGNEEMGKAIRGGEVPAPGRWPGRSFADSCCLSNV